jgi:hypothetical protein
MRAPGTARGEVAQVDPAALDFHDLVTLPLGAPHQLALTGPDLPFSLKER